MISLTVEQDDCLFEVLKWFKEAKKYTGTKFKDHICRQHHVMGGYAGTGKTTCLKELVQRVKNDHPNVRMHICAFTGKATHQIIGTVGGYLPAEQITTIHRLMYRPITDVAGNITGWDRRPMISAQFIVVDEGSMIGPEIWRDMLSYDVPILVVGDPFQLPPIIDNYTLRLFPGAKNFNLMTTPDSMLTEVHRQAQGNPIIRASMYLREQKILPYVNQDKMDTRFMHIPRKDAEKGYSRIEYLGVDKSVTLVPVNAHRVTMNQKIRDIKGYEPRDEDNPSNWIVSGERLVCLLNDYNNDIFNGQLVNVKTYIPKTKDRGRIELDSGKQIEIYPSQLESKTRAQNIYYRKVLTPGAPPSKLPLGLFDYGYALTVHRAQGSQFDHVVMHNYKLRYQTTEEYFRWMYTGVTRAVNNLTLITDI